MDLEFRILGQLEAVTRERSLSLGSPKQRALLGTLLLHANEPVSRDRLIEDLWGDAAPKTVNAVLNVYLSRLRRLLADATGDHPLVRQASGYVLRVSPEQLDAYRFEVLLEKGRRELASGDARLAAQTIRQALGLWRGPALADFTSEPFAQNEIARLEELRLTAFEGRIEAELALGHHHALVAELESLVAAHPYREGIVAQLMLALYRCGRQAEALESYRRARRTFVQELGIEPGPRLQALERAILSQDASLDSETQKPAEEERAEAVGQQRRPMRWVLALTMGLVLVVAVAAVAVDHNPSKASPAPVALEGDSVAVIDADRGTVVGEIPVGGRPTGLAVGEGSVWVANRDDNTLLRIDARSREVVRTIGLSVKPTTVAVGAESVWVLSDWALLRFDPDINEVVGRVSLPRKGRFFPWIFLEVGENSVWVCSCATLDGALAHIDPDTNSMVFMRKGPVGAIEYGDGALWALTGYELGTIERIDPRTNAVVRTLPLGRLGGAATIKPRLIVADEGGSWSATAEALWRIDPSTGRVTGSVPLGQPPVDVAVGDGTVWVAAYDGNVLGIDPTSQTVAATIPLGLRPLERPDAMAVGEGAVWVALTTLVPITP